MLPKLEGYAAALLGSLDSTVLEALMEFDKRQQAAGRTMRPCVET